MFLFGVRPVSFFESVGGGFGGKETRSFVLSTATAVAAYKLVADSLNIIITSFA